MEIIRRKLASNWQARPRELSKIEPIQSEPINVKYLATRDV
jgi:hypothetical protein